MSGRRPHTLANSVIEDHPAERALSLIREQTLVRRSVVSFLEAEDRRPLLRAGYGCTHPTEQLTSQSALLCLA